MSAPNPCPECGGSGWVMYTVETAEGEEELAWSLCPECVGGDAFPRREARRYGMGVEQPEIFMIIASRTLRSMHLLEREGVTKRPSTAQGKRYAAAQRLSRKPRFVSGPFTRNTRNRPKCCNKGA